MTPKRIADDVFEIRTGNARSARALADILRTDGKAEEVVAGLEVVAIKFDPHHADDIEFWLQSVSVEEDIATVDHPLIEIPVQYGDEAGPDLETVCAGLGLTPDEFVAQHASLIHTVEMIGFTPGFAYLSGVPAGMTVPRLDTPRPRLPAGSVGLSAGYTGLYALPGPGGWPIIGRTDEALFDPERQSPFRLETGDRVRFKAL